MKKILYFLFILSSILFSDSIKQVKFEMLDIAKTAQEKKVFRISSYITVTTEEKNETRYPLSYEILLFSEDKVQNSKYPFGTMLNSKGKPFKNKDNSLKISTGQDSNSIIYDGGNTYLVTHFEESVGVMAKTKLALDKAKLKVLSIQSIDFSSIDGINNVCAGSTTPWNTHLGGEESSAESIYEDSKSPFYLDCNNPIFSQEGYCKTKINLQKYLDDKKFNVYNYGYIVEAGIKKGKDIVAKHYVTGKYAPEMAIVTKDNKTIYISDDGENCALFKLVLDKSINTYTSNWQGTLYVARLQSTNGVNAYDIEWIKLGHASDEELAKIISSRPAVTDFFDISKTPKDGYTKISASQTYHLRMKKFNETGHFKDEKQFLQGLAFLESRKYATLLGATVSIEKEEGLAYDAASNKLFMALSRIPNNACGAVYALSLNESFSAYKMDAITVGKELHKDDKEYMTYKDEYFCHPDFIANPDNIAYVGNNILLIGEDTALHFNNMLFAYDIKQKNLTRIATLPTGGEVTGLERALIENKKAIFINTQHPFDDVCTGADEKSNCNSEILKNSTHRENRGFVGYINGLPKEIF